MIEQAKKKNIANAEFVVGDCENFPFEDNDLNIFVAKTILEEYDCIVDVAKNGREAVDAFDRSVTGFYKAILMDMAVLKRASKEHVRRVK